METEKRSGEANQGGPHGAKEPYTSEEEPQVAPESETGPAYTDEIE